MKVQLVTYSNGAKVFDAADAVAKMAAEGFKQTGFSKVGGVLRTELQGQPTYDGLAGPMWGGIDQETGEPTVRYEDWKAYELYST